MPSYFDEQTKTYYCQFYFTDWNGERKKKKKRGFAKKKDAQTWERDFLNQRQGNTSITLENFAKLYFDDMRPRLRKSTIENKEWTCANWIAPYFKNKLIKDISPADIRKWQTELLSTDNAPTYNRMINSQFSAIMNYAVKYYGLDKNPLKIAGTIGKSSAAEMQFYTKDEFDQFIKEVNKEPAYTGFMTLYFTGMRIGELLALTPADIDQVHNTISINKSYRRIGHEDIISEPKTPESIRTIEIPPFLIRDLNKYIAMIYGICPKDRIFNYSRHYFTKELGEVSARANLKRIRVHDMRHSHAALLIEKGFNPLLISQRLGHKDIETTLNTYGHLYPNKQAKLIDCLEELEPK